MPSIPELHPLLAATDRSVSGRPEPAAPEGTGLARRKRGQLHSPRSLRHDYLRPAQYEIGLGAGVTALLLFGDEERTHALGAGAADPLVQARVVRGADHGVV